MSKPIIAIDGTAASGKGTMARLLAEKLGFDYLDTGRLYRAAALACVAADIDINNETQVAQIASTMNINDYSESDLKLEETGNIASKISAYPLLRQALLDFQRNFGQNTAKGAVIEGRDIGTYIFPEAPVKFYVDANIEKRAQRRFKELINSEKPIIYDAVLASLKERDERDKSRKSAPLAIANDAVLLDNSDLTIEQCLEFALKTIKEKLNLTDV